MRPEQPAVPLYEATVTVLPELGLHARPAARLAKAAQQFAAEIRFIARTGEADAKSILDILSLAATKGTEIVVRCTGEDAEEALRAFQELFSGMQAKEQ